MHKSKVIDHALTFEHYGPTAEELSVIYDLCQNKDVIELGSCLGISSYTISSVCKSLSCVDMWEDDLTCYDSDQYQKSTYYKLPKKMIDVFSCNCREFITSGILKMFKGKTSDIASNFKNESCEVLFIDADHSYEGVSGDYHKYKRTVKPDGYILFHDYGPWPGVTRFCKEIMASNELRIVNIVGNLLIFKKE